MRDPASRRMPPGRSSAVLALLFLLVPGPILPAGRADDPPERLTPEQRQELQRQAVEHFKAGQQAYQRGDLTTAVEETRQSLRLFERLYPKTDYPKGHPDLATSLHNLGLVLQSQGDLRRGAGVLRAGAGDVRGPLPQGPLSRRATPTWPPA